MHWTRVLFLLLFSLTLSQCKKKTYPESMVQNEPEFYVDLQSSGGPVLLEAGIANYRVYSSYTQNAAGLYTYVSAFKQKDCNANCRNSIVFEINDAKFTSPGAASDINAALYAGNYEYASPNWSVQFESSYNKPASSYRWNFGDGTESFEKNPVHLYKKGGAYTVCLTITSNTGCENTICNTLEVGYPEDNCAVSVSSSNGPSNAVQFVSSAKGQAPFAYQWSFGDGATSTEAQPNHSYAVRGAYAVRLKVIDAKKDEAVFNYHVITSGDSSSCASNYQIASTVQNVDTLPFSQVTIRYTDNNGETYTSENFTQDADRRFEILSVEDYENNERGEATKKLKVRFTANLYSGSKQIKLTNSEAVICISYKK